MLRDRKLLEINETNLSRSRPLLLTALNTGMISVASAAAVSCNVHAPLGNYTLFLFRIGDRNPTRVDVHVRIDGGKLWTLNNIPSSNWFVKPMLESDPYIMGQRAATKVTGWLPRI